MKRKRSFEDSEDEGPAFQKQILPVADLPEDFDALPIDGMQYLFMVRRDARSLPLVTRAPNPYEVNNVDKPHTDNREIPAHVAFPSQEWRTLFEARFKNFRQNVQQPTNGVFLDTQQKLMPDKKERDLWWAFLSGKSEAHWNPPKYFKKKMVQQWRAGSPPESGLETFNACQSEESWLTVDEGEAERAPHTNLSGCLPAATGLPDLGQVDLFRSRSTISDKETPQPREPMPLILRHVDERMALHLLMYFTHWINLRVQKGDLGFQPVEAHARWMFALLSKVGDQLSADDMCLLRNLARACIALLKLLFQLQIMAKDLDNPLGEEQGRPMSTRSCWMIICIVAGVWAQRDLWQDAEDALRKVE